MGVIVISANAADETQKKFRSEMTGTSWRRRQPGTPGIPGMGSVLPTWYIPTVDLRLAASRV
jgi:hypothetical protein